MKTLVWRAGALLLVLLLELVLLSIWLDTDNLPHTGILGYVWAWGARLLHATLTAGIVIAAVGYRRIKPLLPAAGMAARQRPISWFLALSHVVALGAFCAISAVVFTRHLPPAQANFLGGLWIVAGVSTVPLALFSVLPLAVIAPLTRAIGWLPAFAAAVGLASSWTGDIVASLWSPLAGMTFRVVRFLLRPLIDLAVADPHRLVIGSARFQVEIARQCSGLEGIGLILVFTLVWLWYFRDELRFPRALVLIPGGVAVIWVLNAFRIAGLILIGHAGAPEIALGGFHSQAGWLAFSGVAVGISTAATRSPWFRSTATVQPRREAKSPATLHYLLPFAALLTVGMISHAASPGFERFYSLRLLTAVAVLWTFRSQYRQLDWRCGWTAPVIGVAVFLAWMALDFSGSHERGSAMAAGLGALAPLPRVLWISTRILAAVVTVPVAEELAFRGFLIRRILRVDFESLDPRTFTIPALVISSLAFGLLHGGFWLAGTIAGLAYAAAWLRSGRIGDAVVAHATTNALLAVAVLATGKWYLW